MGDAFITRRGGGGRVIKSIQHLVLTALTGNTNVSLGGANLSNCLVVLQELTGPADIASGIYSTAGFDTSAGYVTVKRASDYHGLKASLMIVEFEPFVVKSRQAGVISLTTSNLTATNTIISVDPAKTMLAYAGLRCQDSGNFMPENRAYVTLEDATTVRATRADHMSSASYVYWNLIEFK